MRPEKVFLFASLFCPAVLHNRQKANCDQGLLRFVTRRLASKLGFRETSI